MKTKRMVLPEPIIPQCLMQVTKLDYQKFSYWQGPPSFCMAYIELSWHPMDEKTLTAHHPNKKLHTTSNKIHMNYCLSVLTCTNYNYKAWKPYMDFWVKCDLKSTPADFKPYRDRKMMNLCSLYLPKPPSPAPSKRGNLGPVPAPVARGCHGPLWSPLYADLELGANGPREWHRKGEGGHGRGPWQRLGGRRVRGQGELTGRGRAVQPRK